MASTPGTHRRVTDINVTPLVDVVLVLLIIFMVMTPLAEKQMPVRVPRRDADATPVARDAVPPDQTVLTVKANGRVLLNGRDRSIDEAMTELRAAFGGRASKVLFFDADDGASYELAVKVLDLAHQAGVATVGMITDPPVP